jgi:hypothetical protein
MTVAMLKSFVDRAAARVSDQLRSPRSLDPPCRRHPTLKGLDSSNPPRSSRQAEDCASLGTATSGAPTAFRRSSHDTLLPVPETPEDQRAAPFAGVQITGRF